MGAVRAQRWLQSGGIKKGFLEEETSKLDKGVGENEHVSGRRNSMNERQEGGAGVEGPGLGELRVGGERGGARRNSQQSG